MNSHSRVTVFALLAASTSLAPIAWTQADSSTQLKPAGAAPTVAAPDSAPHKHGMFAKLKSVAKNKTVQNIAKTAVCTAVPGGSLVVSAVDAHNSGQSATQAIKGAAGSPGCMPGIPGMSSMAGMPGMPGAKGLGAMGALGGMPPGLTSKATGGVVAAAAVQTSVALQTAVMNGAIARASSGGGAPGAKGAPNAAATMSQMQTAAAANGEVPTEAAGRQVQLSGTPADEIKKGKLVIKHIDWMAGSPSVSAPSMSGFVDLVHTVGDAVKAAGARYRVDIYMDKHYSDGNVAALAPQRQAMIIALMQDRVQTPDVTIAGNVKKDKEQRVEIVRIK